MASSAVRPYHAPMANNLRSKALGVGIGAAALGTLDATRHDWGLAAGMAVVAIACFARAIYMWIKPNA
jgi:hypothetical protein